MREGLARARGAAIGWGGPGIDDVLAAAHSLQWLHQRGAGIDRTAAPALVATTTPFSMPCAAASSPVPAST